MFLRNLLLHEEHPLRNRKLHISGAFHETEKPYIATKKPDIATEKPYIDELKTYIEKTFKPKTARNVLCLLEAFPDGKIFGRADVMTATDLKQSRSSELLQELAARGIVEPVSGYGKGKYRFRQE